MLKINVITQLIIFMIIAILINQLNLKVLFVLLAIFSFILIIKKNHLFINSLMRFRWLFLVLMIIYVFNTPGEHLQGWSFYLNPTYEGIVAGLTQAMRISLILAMISWIMASNTKQQLVSGFYYMLLPFKPIGLEADRFAARLWLTLLYVELQQQSKNREAWMDKLKNITKFDSEYTSTHMQDNDRFSLSIIDTDVIDFVMPKFHLTDYLAFAVLLLIVARVIF
jgi:energy-coupling factor transporter transmembrane protein EcfT